MVQLKPRFHSFEDYLAYDDGSDQLYELFNGELVAVPPEAGLNVEIANLFLALLLPIVEFRRIRGHGLELGVRGEPKNRYPGLTVIREEHIELLKKCNTIRLMMPPPILVLEVVSPGNLQRDRDYVAKRHQYEEIGIPEYWIVDPQAEEILVLELVNGSYQERVTFRGSDRLSSSQLGDLSMTAVDTFGETTPL